jgi:hypothetical protein
MAAGALLDIGGRSMALQLGFGLSLQNGSNSSLYMSNASVFVLSHTLILSTESTQLSTVRELPVARCRGAHTLFLQYSSVYPLSYSTGTDAHIQFCGPRPSATPIHNLKQKQKHDPVLWVMGTMMMLMYMYMHLRMS